MDSGRKQNASPVIASGISFAPSIVSFSETFDNFVAAPAHGNKPCFRPSPKARRADESVPTQELRSHVSRLFDWSLLFKRPATISLILIVISSDLEGPAGTVSADFSFSLHQSEHSLMNGDVCTLPSLYVSWGTLFLTDKTNCITSGFLSLDSSYSSTSLMCWV